MTKYLIAALLCFGASGLSAQFRTLNSAYVGTETKRPVPPGYLSSMTKYADTPANIWSVTATYRLHVPTGDLADRFGLFSSLSPGGMFKHYSGWTVQFDLQFMFGEDITEDGVLDSIKTSRGFVINNRGEIDDVRLKMRGYLPELKIGRIIPLPFSNRNSGLLLQAGVGFMYHKLRIETSRAPAQVTGDYAAGYDRLTNGWAITGSVGYFNIDPRNFWNFFIGAEYGLGFTRNRRAYNFDEMRRDDRARRDAYFAVRIGYWLTFRRNLNRGGYVEPGEDEWMQ